jgi:putative phosphoribosyl transferase
MTPVNRYRDRAEAGQALARHLGACAGRDDTLVLALPRGGVPVGAEIARALGLPIDVFVVRKLGLPDNPELAMGALATGGIRLLDESLIATENVSPSDIARVVQKESAELARREQLYRGTRPTPELAGRRVILVDDGVATGYTMRVAVLALQAFRLAHLTIAVPVGAPETCATLASAVDEFVCPTQPTPFHAVGLWYDHFPSVTDAEIHECLADPARRS